MNIYGFVEDTTSRAQKHNRQRYKSLVQEDAFAYKVCSLVSNIGYHLIYHEQDCVVGDSGFVEHKVFTRLLHTWGFSREYKPAELFSMYFLPVSVATIAGIMTFVSRKSFFVRSGSPYV